MTYPAPPKIAPPAREGPRPFWSVMIPTYNRTTYLERTLRSVLSQAPGPDEMQIEVIDNASPTDDPEPLVRRVGGGRVGFTRQPKNIGLFGNCNTCIERSRGKWAHILHDDDFVLPGFYERSRTALEERGELGAAFCRTNLIDENEQWAKTSELLSPTAGILDGFLEKLALSNRICTPAIVVRRDAYEKVGGYRLDLPYTADWEMWIRIAAHYSVWYEPEILAAWRFHSRSATSAFLSSAGDVGDLRRCIDISHSYLPPDSADRLSRKAREWLFVCSFAVARHDLGRGDFITAFKHVREGLRCGVSPRSMLALLSGVADLGRRWIRTATNRRTAG